jgi:phosphate starvation-inducible PhoH-like protein
MMIPKTPNQALYLKKLLMMTKPVIVVSGPAGSGKTMMACTIAAEKIRQNQFARIIITRPAVSADEELGFLPGKLEAKMEPWIKPMYEIFEREKVHKNVEIVPLAYMRGRTFHRSFIIADEMQNSTANQMKMVLTRLGESSKMVVAGDMDQSDLMVQNGLYDFMRRMEGQELEYIDTMQLTDDDIQRSAAVREIIRVLY